VVVSADTKDNKDNQKPRATLQADPGSSTRRRRASSTPDGPRRVTERSQGIKVQPAVAPILRNRIGGCQATIALALSQELNEDPPASGRSNMILAQRGRKDGVIAHDWASSSACGERGERKCGKATDHIAGKVDKADKDKVAGREAEKPEKIEKRRSRRRSRSRRSGEDGEAGQAGKAWPLTAPRSMRVGERPPAGGPPPRCLFVWSRRLSRLLRLTL